MRRQYYLEGTGPSTRDGRGGTFPTRIRPLVNVRMSVFQSTARVPTFKSISLSSHRALSPAVPFSERAGVSSGHAPGKELPPLARGEEEGDRREEDPMSVSGWLMASRYANSPDSPCCALLALRTRNCTKYKRVRREVEDKFSYICVFANLTATFISQYGIKNKN